MSIDYENAVKNLKQSDPDIVSVAIIEGKDALAYSTENWNISADVQKLVSTWETTYGQSITISGKKYAILQSTPERLIATSINEGHIVGAKDDERKIIVSVKPNGNMLTVYILTARTLKSLSTKEPYMTVDTELGKEASNSILKELDTPKLREELFKGLVDFFKKGGKLEKPDEFDVKRREKERKKRMEELEKVLQALDITEEDKYVSISINAEFRTDFIYDDFQLLKIKRRIEQLIKEEFQISEPLKVTIIKRV
jgi:hypothetical protein